MSIHVPAQFSPPAAILKAYHDRGYTLAQLEAAERARERKARMLTARRIAEPVVKPVAPRPIPITVRPRIDTFDINARLVWMVVLLSEEDGAELIAPSVPVYPIAMIQAIVARAWDVPVRDIISARRTAEIVEPRMVAVWLTKQLTTRSLPEIGRRFGGRDHTTCLHSIRKIEARMSGDSAFAARVNAVRAIIENAA